MQLNKTLKSLPLCIAAGLMATLPVASFAAEPLKVAFVYLGPRGDGGWTQQHDMGRLGLEKEMGDKIKTTFVENVPETADSERVFRQLASDGYTLIFATSFGYMEPLQKVAKLFPKVKFEHFGLRAALRGRLLSDRRPRRTDDEVEYARLHRVVPDSQRDSQHRLDDAWRAVG